MVTCYIYLYYSMHQTTCPGDKLYVVATLQM